MGVPVVSKNDGGWQFNENSDRGAVACSLYTVYFDNNVYNFFRVVAILHMILHFSIYFT